MGDFFKTLATKLAERWVTLLVVPGALLVFAAWVGGRLRQAHALDWAALQGDLAATVADLTRQSWATQAVLVIAALLVSTGVGLAVQALAGVTKIVWLGQWPQPLRWLARWRTSRRVRRWYRRLERRRELERAHPAEQRTPEQQRQINEAAARVNRLCWAEPGRPTWMGDRGHSVEKIILDRQGLDLAFAWPRLWLVLPETPRAEITAANAAFAAAVATGTWAVPYLLLGIMWWPAAVAGLVVGVTGWVRGRSAASELALLTEATLDLHGRTLAVALGVAAEDTVGPLELEEGQRISTMARKGR
ncbi:hypothetical protein [Kutzneria kofuensis]|uniref:Uncharacterized protein n=1 Tax=Kutzneria kofuensis TaxID=103725 RepID=A0A7W9NEH8_9PSEU|nr:hypothetical protein [Kutzneria kofuensis]MBB5889161.1 hypothetical protein [Kutzneria kofuensis]